jgi:hypothetical protein
MKYEQLNETYHDDVIAEALYARELEYFHYEFDKKNFIEILKLTTNPTDIDHLTNRLDETIKQMNNVEIYIKALKNQIRSEKYHIDAVERAKIKRSLKEK